MTKNPYINAGLAALYIVGIVLFISVVLAPQGDEPETILIPITMLCLFVISAATMGYIFFYQPLMMYLEGDKNGAVRFFLKTLGAFATLTFFIVTALIISSQ